MFDRNWAGEWMEISVDGVRGIHEKDCPHVKERLNEWKIYEFGVCCNDWVVAKSEQEAIDHLKEVTCMDVTEYEEVRQMTQAEAVKILFRTDDCEENCKRMGQCNLARCAMIQDKVPAYLGSTEY